MQLTPQELLAFAELKDRINSWFDRGTAVFNRDHQNTPPEQFVLFADITLTDMERVIREPTLSSSKILELLSKDYAFISSVRIEPETGRIHIEINRRAHEEPTSTT